MLVKRSRDRIMRRVLGQESENGISAPAPRKKNAQLTSRKSLWACCWSTSIKYRSKEGNRLRQVEKQIGEGVRWRDQVKE